MSMTEIETIAWNRFNQSAEASESCRVHFATGDIPLTRIKGMRFERIAARSVDNPHGLWIMR